MAVATGNLTSGRHADGHRLITREHVASPPLFPARRGGLSMLRSISDSSGSEPTVREPMRRPRRRPPIRLRETAVEWLARRKRGYRLFQKLGRLYRVQDIRVAGDYGPVEGALDDSGVLQVYPRSGGWARTPPRFFPEIFYTPRRRTFLHISPHTALYTIPPP